MIITERAFGFESPDSVPLRHRENRRKSSLRCCVQSKKTCTTVEIKVAIRDIKSVPGTNKY